ncbi:hypothetical protein [Nitratifractor sp.]
MRIDWNWSLLDTTKTLEQHLRSINSWTQEYTLQIKAPAETTLQAVGRAKRAWYLDYDRELREIQGKISPPFPVGNLLVIENDKGLYQIDLPKFPYLELEFDGRSFMLHFPIRSKNAAGLALWGEQKINDAEEEITLTRRIYRLNSLKEVHWVEPYPDGAKAVVCLTDHADWDSVEKLDKLADLFKKYDFRFTKSIFPHSDPQEEKQEPGLDDPTFTRVIDKLYGMGTEIAYHGFSPRIEPPSFKTVEERIALMRRYRPVTWIDHGTGCYLFSRKGRCENGIDLVELLGNEGIENYWSYTDVWENPGPSGSLNLWRRRRIVESFSDIHSLMKSKECLSAEKVAYLLISLPENIFGSSDYRRPKNLYRPKNFRFLMEKSKKLHALHRRPFGLYNRHGFFSFKGTPKDPLVFDSILLNHLSLQLAPEAMNRLSKENGLLLAHCYMGAQHRYGGSNIFDSKNNILPSFRENIESLHAMQKRSELRSVSLLTLTQSLKNFEETRFVKEDDSWKEEQ